MNTDIYSTPEADVTPDRQTEQTDAFYVVSPLKFGILYIATMGIYSIYWFYKNWSIIKLNHGRNIRPALRAIFNIFFVISLFSEIERALKEKTGQVWNGKPPGALYIVLAIASNLVELAIPDILGMATYLSIFAASIILPGSILLSAQTKANLACDQPGGESNALFTPVNILFTFLGVGLWLLIAYGMAYDGYY